MNRFKYLRRQLHLSQQQVASLMHISRRTYGIYERGERFPTLRFNIAFAHALNIPLEELMDAKAFPQPVMPISSEEENLLLIYRRLDSEGKSYIFNELVREESLCQQFPEDPT